MYRHCIHCSAALGANDALERFPVGRTVAFDAAKGRLWAVCRRCARWNLAPVEERWEAVEAAERAFAGARLRAHSENVGVAKLRDGTRLVRVGAAVPRELAAWRYGTELVGRHRRREWRENAANVAVGTSVLAAGTLAGGIVFAVLPLGSLATTPVMAAVFGLAARGAMYVAGKLVAVPEKTAGALSAYGDALARRRVVHLVPAGDSPTGARLVVRRGHLRGAWIRPGEDGGPVLHLPPAPAVPSRLPGAGLEALEHPVALKGSAALGALGRALVGINDHGAKRSTLDLVLAEVGRAPTPGDYLRGASERGVALGLPPADVDAYWEWRAEAEGVPPEARYGWRSAARRAVAGGRGGIVLGLALEMALHEERERRAMEGELALLESAWREAEEIAAIADRLAADALPPPREG